VNSLSRSARECKRLLNWGFLRRWISRYRAGSLRSLEDLTRHKLERHVYWSGGSRLRSIGSGRKPGIISRSVPGDLLPVRVDMPLTLLPLSGCSSDP
jgi:hypothetical protein